MVQVPPLSIRFGIMTLDLKTGELKKSGLPIRLAPQPSKVLVFLAARAGQIVTREEIREHIWRNETFVDFDKGLNFCVKQIRAALGDSADHPIYIETLPRRGYRFIAPVENAIACASPSESAPAVIEKQKLREIPAMSAAAAWTRAPWGRLVLVAAILLIALGYAAFKRSKIANFGVRGWVLIGAFENKTDQPIFDGIVEPALAGELAQSQLINVVPPERVQNALRLMRRDKLTPLGPDIAREVALRDGNTSLILIGIIEKVGHTYILSASVTEPSSGLVERSLSEQAADEDAILPAVHRLAVQVRSSIGEIEAQANKQPEVLEQATTSSLSGLQFYSRGIKFLDQDKWAEGTEMFRRAVQEDPDFAAAHIYLAWCYLDAGKQKQAVPHFEKALALADRASDRERYFIQGSYYDAMAHDPKRAVEEYEILTQLYPDDFWGNNNLAMDLENDLGRPQDAIPYRVKLADLRPDALDANFSAWQALSQNGGDPGRAQVFLQRAEALADRSETSLKFPDIWVQLNFRVVDEYLREGDSFRALQEIERLSSKGDHALGDARWLFADELGNRYVALGRLHDAERFYQQLPKGEKDWELGSLAEIRGDKETLRKELLEQFASGAELGPGTAARMAREGLINESEQVLTGHAVAEMLRSAQPNNPVALHVQVARGELAFALGRRQQGLQQMTEAWQSMRSQSDGWSWLAAEILSDALSKSGNTRAAIRVLELQLTAKFDPLLLNAVAVCEERLTRLYESVGRQQEARALGPQIARQLPLADPDYPALINIGTVPQYVEQ